MMNEFQERVINERKELNDKMIKLHEFITNNTIFRSLSEEDQLLLKDQYRVMRQYSDILDRRIERF